MDTAESKPRPAATVVVIRKGEARPEVFMARRHSKAVFASHYVFPGGVVDTVDSEVHERSAGVTSGEANALLRTSRSALDFYSAAIREVFEEASVLLARTANGSWAFCDRNLDQEVIDDYRKQLHSGDLNWQTFLESLDLRLAYDSLHYFAFWVTPKIRKRRFSTRFFLSVIPDGQCAVHDKSELTDSRWMTAGAVLRESERGEMKLMLPTLSTLQEMAQYETIEEMIRWAQRRASSGVMETMPAVVRVDGKDVAVFPGSPDYPVKADA